MTNAIRKPFNIKFKTLLANLKRRLDLPTDWEKLQRKGAASLYRHGNYRLCLIIDRRSEQVEVIIIEAAGSDRVPVDAVVKLLAYVMPEIDSASAPDDCTRIVNQIFPGEDAIIGEGWARETQLNGNSYDIAIVPGQGLLVTIARA